MKRGGGGGKKKKKRRRKTQRTSGERLFYSFIFFSFILMHNDKKCTILEGERGGERMNV